MKKLTMNNGTTSTSATTVFNPVVISKDMAIVASNNPCNIGRYVQNNEGTLVFLLDVDVERIRKMIRHCCHEDYKLTVQVVSVILEMSGVNKHIRHKIERRLISSLGGHEHTYGIRRKFICG